MTTNKTFWAVACLSFALITPLSRGAADDLFAGPVIAKGKGVDVRRSHLDDAFIAYRANLAARGQGIPENRREAAEAQLLDRMIVTQLLVQKATAEDRAKANTNAVKFMEESRKNADSDEAFVRHIKSLGLSMAQFTNRVMEQAVSQEVVAREITSKIVIAEADVKRFYETNSETFRQPETARASHILIATRDLKTGLPLTAEQKQAKKELAEKILARAKKEPDFAALVVELSEEPEAKQTKGEYKFARAKDDPRRAMVPEFEKAAFALKVGEISDLVTTEYGYHIIKLHDITPARQVPLDEVKERIREHLVQAETEKRLPIHFAALKKEAGVEVLDEKLRAALDRAAAEVATPTP